MKNFIFALLIASQLAFAAGETRIKGGVISPGSVAVGKSTAADSKAILDLTSTTKGMLSPRMTTVQRDAIASPPTGLEIYNTTTNQKNVYTGSGWVAVGAGGGSGINFVSQSTTWAVTGTDDRDLDLSVGNWAAFDDGAVTAPVDMTGGSPGVTCTRSTSNPLDGTASLLVTKDAADRQGEGCSVVFNVQPNYQGSVATISFGLQISSGSLVQGDVKVFIYDVTNSLVITPYNNDIISGPTVTASFPLTARAATPANQQYRIGIFFASTSATAVTLKADNFAIAPGQAAYGLAGTNTKTVTMTPSAGFGTVATPGYVMYQHGDRAYFEGRFVSGTVAASTASIDLPSGMLIDTTKMPSTASNGVIVGEFQQPDTGAGPTALGTRVIIFDGSDTNTLFFTYRGGSNNLNKENGSTLFANTQLVTFKFSVPLASFDSNVSVGASSTFRISNYLVNGSRVTSTPTALGQYRTYVKSATSTGAGTDNAPSAGPSVADGMRVYGNVAYTAAGTSGQTGRWEAYVGLNKNVRFDFWASAGRTGAASVARTQNKRDGGDKQDCGLLYGYDPVTGVIFVDGMAQADSQVDNRCAGQAIPTAGAAPTDIDGGGLASVYWDVVVSENAQFVTTQSPRSTIRVNTGAGHGSTNTKIRQITNVVESVGTGITYANSGTAGTSFTINEDGIYSVSYWDSYSGGVTLHGITKNSSQLTTDIDSTTAANILCEQHVALANHRSHCGSTVYLRAGDVIRPHTRGQNDMTAAEATGFIITKVSH